MKECGDCSKFDNCTPSEKQLSVERGVCEDFIDINYNCFDYGSAWKEFSYERYTENILDYGEPSEWDLFIVEEIKYKET